MTSSQSLPNTEIATNATDSAGQPDPGRKKGGRPPLPPAPKNASDTRALIAQEVVKTKPSQSRLRYLRALLHSFEDAEVQAKAEAAAVSANRLQQEASDLKRAEIEQKRLEYQRRRELGEHRQSAEGSKRMTALQDENVRLQAKVSEQEASMKKLQDEYSEMRGKYLRQLMEMPYLQRQADELVSIKAGVQSELKSVCNADERIAILRAELESLKKEGPLANLDRIKAIFTELKVLGQVMKGEG